MTTKLVCMAPDGELELWAVRDGLWEKYANSLAVYIFGEEHPGIIHVYCKQWRSPEEAGREVLSEL